MTRPSLLTTLDARALGLDAVVARLERPPSSADPAIAKAVEDIVGAVQARGDDALVELTARFDRYQARTVRILPFLPSTSGHAERALPAEVRQALGYAADRIERYHAAAMPKSWRITDEHGSVLGQDVRPLDRVGVYIPGRPRRLSLHVLMTAIPARVAGVREIAW